MSVSQIRDAALALTPEERADLAQRLWESLDATHFQISEEFLKELALRDQQLSSGEVVGRTHDEVMARARNLR